MRSQGRFFLLSLITTHVLYKTTKDMAQGGIYMNEFESGTTAREMSDTVYEVVFTPVLERPEYQGEPIHGKLLALREAMGEEDFNRYINSLLRITYNGRALWLITRSERNRTLIEGKYLPLIAKIFDVAAPRVFSQP